MDDRPFPLRSASMRLTVAVIGGAMLGGSLAALIALVALSCGYRDAVYSIVLWAGIGAGLGAIQAATHVGLHLHREWCEANLPHDHDH